MHSGHSGQQAARLHNRVTGLTAYPVTCTFTSHTFLVLLDAMSTDKFVNPIGSSSSGDDSKQSFQAAEPRSDAAVSHVLVSRSMLTANS